MPCDACGFAKPSAHVVLRHNVGMIVARRTYVTDADLCRTCLGAAMKKHQLSNLALGFWGFISFFATIYYLVDNILAHGRAKAELDALETRAVANDEAPNRNAAGRLEPFVHNVRLRLRGGERPDEIAYDLVKTHGVTLLDANTFVSNVLETGRPANV